MARMTIMVRMSLSVFVMATTITNGAYALNTKIVDSVVDKIDTNVLDDMASQEAFNVVIGDKSAQDAGIDAVHYVERSTREVRLEQESMIEEEARRDATHALHYAFVFANQVVGDAKHVEEDAEEEVEDVLELPSSLTQTSRKLLAKKKKKAKKGWVENYGSKAYGEELVAGAHFHRQARANAEAVAIGSEASAKAKANAQTGGNFHTHGKEDPTAVYMPDGSHYHGTANAKAVAMTDDATAQAQAGATADNSGFWPNTANAKSAAVADGVNTPKAKQAKGYPKYQDDDVFKYDATATAEADATGSFSDSSAFAFADARKFPYGGK